MAITKVGTRYRGEKLDRVNDSLGSSVDGINTGITLLTGAETLKNTPDSDFDFSSDSGWTQVGSTVAISTGALRASTVNTGSDDRIHKALGYTLSNSKWTCQFEVTLSSSNYVSIITLSDGSNTLNAYDTIHVDYGSSKLKMREYNGSSQGLNSTGITTSNGTNYFVTLSRLSATKLKLDVRTGSHTGTLVGSETGTINSGTVDLDTIQSGAYGRQSGDATYVVDNVKIYNDSITKDSDSKLGSGAYSLNGSSSKVVLGSASDWKFLSDATANTWSIAWWMIYDDTLENGHTIMSTSDGSTQNDGFFIDNSGSGTLRLIQVDGNDGSWSSAIPDNTSWHHYAITWNAGTVTLYVDGVSKGTQSQTAGSGTPQYALHLGVNNDEYYTALTLDDIGIWKRVLTATEVGKLANNNQSPLGNWVNGNSTHFYSSNNSLYVKSDTNSIQKNITYDLNTNDSITIGSSFVITFKVDIKSYSANTHSGNQHRAYIGLSSGTTVGEPASLDELMVGLCPRSDVQKWESFNNNGGTTDYTASTLSLSTGVKYVKLTRDGNTSFTVGIYNNADFSDTPTTATSNSNLSSITGTNLFKISQYVEGNSGTLNFELDDIKIYNGTTSTSGTPTKEFTFTQGDAQLVSSLTNKSGLKANYTMDSTSLGATRTWIDTDGEEGTGSGEYDGSNTNTGGSISWQKYDETNDEIDFKSIRNDNVKTAITKDITVSNNGMNEALSTSKWLMRFKVRFDTFQHNGDTNIKPRLTSFDRNTASNNDNYSGGDGFSLEFYNASTPFVRFGWGRNEQVDQNSIGSDVTISASAQTFFIEVNRDGTTLTCKCSTSAYGSTDVFNKSGTVDSDWGDSGTPLKYFGLWEGSGVGQTAYLQGAVHDIQVYNGVSSLDGCKNDASSTSDLEAMTNLPVNTIFEQTDDTPSYWWKQSDNTWKSSGIPTPDAWWDMSASDTTTSNVTDKTGNGHTLVQSTSSKRPSVVSSAQNGLNALSFAVNDDYMITTDNMTMTPLQTMFFVVKVTKETANGWQYYLTDGGTGYNSFNQYSDNWRIQTGNTVDVSNTSWDRWLVITVQYNGSSSFIRDNGSQTSFAGTLESGNSTGFTLNGYAGKTSAADAGKYGTNADWGECIIYNKTLSAADIVVVEQYLKDKWGTP